MSSSRVGHEQDEVLNTKIYPNKLKSYNFYFIGVIIFVTGFVLNCNCANGLNVKNKYEVNNNNNRSSINSNLDDLEPKSGLELESSVKNVSKTPSFPTQKFGFGDGTGTKSHDLHNSANVTGDHGHGHNNSSGGPGAGHEHGHGQGHGHGHGNGENETETNKTGHAIPQDPFSVEDILRKIFGEFEEEDEAEEEELFSRADRREDAAEDDDDETMIMQESRAEIEPISEKSGATTNGSLVKLTRQARDESESHQRNLPRKNKVKPGQKRKPGTGSSSVARPNGPKQKQPTKAQNLVKYNEYMDAVLGRMNVLIKKKRMDPLRVNLYSGPSKGGNKGNKNKNSNRNPPRKNQKGKKKNSNNARMDLDDDDTIPLGPGHAHDDDDESDDIDDEDEINDENGPAIRDVNLNKENIDRQVRSLLSNISGLSHSLPKSDGDVEENPFANSEVKIDSVDTYEEEGRSSNFRQGNSKNKTSSSSGSGSGSGKGKKRKQNSPSSSSSSSSSVESDEAGSGNKSPSPAGGKPKQKVKNSNNKNKNRNPNTPRPTRGILHGLSTLRRDGNVQVVRDGAKARIVRAKFLLGPVALEILPKRGKKAGSSREASSQPANPLTPSTTSPVALTATAPQLKGVLEVRLSPSSPTRIRKLRVFPPGKVQVDGDKTDKSVAAGLRGPGYKKISPHATVRLRQAAVQVVRQVDHKMKVH